MRRDIGGDPCGPTFDERFSDTFIDAKANS